MLAAPFPTVNLTVLNPGSAHDLPPGIRQVTAQLVGHGGWWWPPAQHCAMRGAVGSPPETGRSTTHIRLATAGREERGDPHPHGVRPPPRGPVRRPGRAAFRRREAICRVAAPQRYVASPSSRRLAAGPAALETRPCRVSGQAPTVRVPGLRGQSFREGAPPLRGSRDAGPTLVKGHSWGFARSGNAVPSRRSCTAHLQLDA